MATHVNAPRVSAAPTAHRVNAQLSPCACVQLQNLECTVIITSTPSGCIFRLLYAPERLSLVSSINLSCFRCLVPHLCDVCCRQSCTVMASRVRTGAPARRWWATIAVTARPASRADTVKMVRQNFYVTICKCPSTCSLYGLKPSYLDLYTGA